MMSMQAIQTSWRTARMVPMKTGAFFAGNKQIYLPCKSSHNLTKGNTSSKCNDIANTQNTRNA